MSDVDVIIYAPGDWVVHRHHGIGQIESLETKFINEQENSYYKIVMFNSTLWLPVEKVNDDWLRPIATQAEMKKALDILKSPPQPMSDNQNSRKSQIGKVESYDLPVIIAELLRDLWALKKEKKTLYKAEEDSLRHLTECFLAEWAVSLDVPVEGAKQRFEELLLTGQEQGLDKPKPLAI